MKAREAGWHISRYNLYTPVPDEEKTVIVNLFRGNCAVYTPMECYFLSIAEDLDADHPLIRRFAERGLLVNFDEQAALESMSRVGCSDTRIVSLTICPTMGCNFDCPYCFENHKAGIMSPAVQDGVVALAEKMLDVSHAGKLDVVWFGGEPLLAPDVIKALSERLMEAAGARRVEYTASVITNGYLLTQSIADMLDRVKVESVQITIDGIGASHDATRHLAGGGPTFDTIVSRLRNVRIPFPVIIRHNVHEGNLDDVRPLRDYIARLATESGNHLQYYPHAVFSNKASTERSKQVGLLCSAAESDISLVRAVTYFPAAQGSFCGANRLWFIGIDAEGNLQKCWENVDKPEYSFGSVFTWDPANPLVTAAHPDLLTAFLNCAIPLKDDECRECIWLPICRGGCPHRRLFTQRQCLAFRDKPERYAWALYERMKLEKRVPKA